MVSLISTWRNTVLFVTPCSVFHVRIKVLPFSCVWHYLFLKNHKLGNITLLLSSENLISNIILLLTKAIPYFYLLTFSPWCWQSSPSNRVHKPLGELEYKREVSPNTLGHWGGLLKMLGLSSTSGQSPARESRSCCQEKQRETTNCYQTTAKCSHLSSSSEKITVPKPWRSKVFHSKCSQDTEGEKIRQEWRRMCLTSLRLTLAVSFPLLIHLHFR